MSIISSFGGRYPALDYAYGTSAPSAPPALQVGQGNSSTGSASITIINPVTETQGGVSLSVLAVGTPITVGNSGNAETVTVTAVGAASLGAAGPAAGAVTITASFANLHGPQENVTSSTFGLQEAINFANAQGGGTVLVSPRWYTLGGTVVMIQAAVLPTNGTVRIFDELNLEFWANRSQSLSLVAAPSIPLSTQLAPNTLTGTFTAATYYFNFIYVTANGGLSLASSQYSVTCTANGVSGSGPIASTGAVGYLVASSVTSTTYINNPNAATSTGTVIQCGSIACFKIGTSFIISAPGTSALPLVPPLSTAFTTVQPAPFASPAMAQPFQTTFGPFTSTGSITSGTVEAARVDLPTGFLNQVGRTLRVKFNFIFTPVSTGALLPTLNLYSLYGTTSVALWTVTTVNTSGTTASNGMIEVDLTVAATGATGTVEAHGFMVAHSATASHPAMLATGDAIQAASSAIDLTKQNTLTLSFTETTAAVTVQVRQMTVEILV